MKKWQDLYPPYEGAEPYLYFAFAEADARKVRRIMRILLSRGCRVWYALGDAGSAEALLRRQKRAEGAVMTLLYLTDAACADQDTKSAVLVNQKFGRRICAVSPDRKDRKLAMGLRATTPCLCLQDLRKDADLEAALVHMEGFSQDLLGDPVPISRIDPAVVTAGALCAAALAGVLFCVTHFDLLHPAPPVIPDEVVFREAAIETAVRASATEGVITEELTQNLRILRLESMPGSWEELRLLPALERIEIPQSILLGDAPLPEGDYTFVLTGGEGL